MKSLKHRSFWIIGLALLIAACCPLFAFAAEEAAEPVLYGTFWSLIPPIIAIALALFSMTELLLTFQTVTMLVYWCSW